MIIGAWTAAILAAMAPAQGICVKSGEAAGVTRAWYRNADPVRFENRTFVKLGLPRAVPLSALDYLQDIDGVPVMVEKGVREHEVLYLLADMDCSVQPYQIQPN